MTDQDWALTLALMGFGARLIGFVTDRLTARPTYVYTREPEPDVCEYDEDDREDYWKRGGHAPDYDPRYD